MEEKRQPIKSTGCTESKFSIAGNSSLYLIEEAGTFSWLKSLGCIFLFVFACGAMYMTGEGQLKTLGMILTGYFILLMMGPNLGRIFPMPAEIVMFVLWGAWSAATGILIAESKFFFWNGGLSQVLQTLILVLAVYGITRLNKQKALYAVMCATLVGGIIQAVAARSETISLGGIDSGERALGLSENSNTLGFLMLWALIAIMLLLKRNSGVVRKTVLIFGGLIVPLFIYSLLGTGSRKTLLAFLFLFFAWIVYAMAPRYRAKAILWTSLFLLVSIMLAGPLIDFLEHNTTAGQRMLSKMSVSSNLVEAESKRFYLYKEGFDFFIQNPIAGFGLNQFKIHSTTGLYSHSNYMEPLANTGLVGFVLYQGIFFLPLIRAYRLSKMPFEQGVVYHFRMIVIAGSIIVLLGFGTVWTQSVNVMPLLALFSAYTYSAELSLRTATGRRMA
ncbi:MAG: O-antigen ligase family protein [Phycisphaerae bacterium]